MISLLEGLETMLGMACEHEPKVVAVACSRNPLNNLDVHIFKGTRAAHVSLSTELVEGTY
jgi:hypothetical protein